jgi:hypothetical protein
LRGNRITTLSELTLRLFKIARSLGMTATTSPIPLPNRRLSQLSILVSNEACYYELLAYIRTGRNIDETDARDEAARSDLQHIAIRDGRDLRAEYEAGNIGLSGLKALARGDPLPSTPSPDTEPEVPSPPIPGHSAPSVPTKTSGGAKAIATAFGGANAWPGVSCVLCYIPPFPLIYASI